MAKNQNTVVTATQKTEPNAKKDALATALAQIEKQFGKGAIMKLGDNTAMQVDAIPPAAWGWIWLWVWVVCPADVSSRSMARSPAVRRPWPCMSWQKHRKKAARWRLST